MRRTDRPRVVTPSTGHPRAPLRPSPKLPVSGSVATTLPPTFAFEIGCVEPSAIRTSVSPQKLHAFAAVVIPGLRVPMAIPEWTSTSRPDSAPSGRAQFGSSSAGVLLLAERGDQNVDEAAHRRAVGAAVMRIDLGHREGGHPGIAE